MNRSEYGCPKCGWQAGDPYDNILLEDCYYKFEGDKLKVISMFDLMECNKPAPEDYYPKMTGYSSDLGMDSGSYSWLETWLCPDCKIEFSFNNGT